MHLYVLSFLAVVALAASLFIGYTQPFQFKDNGTGPDYRPSAGISGALMMLAIVALALVLGT